MPGCGTLRDKTGIPVKPAPCSMLLHSPGLSSRVVSPHIFLANPTVKFRLGLHSGSDSRELSAVSQLHLNLSRSQRSGHLSYQFSKKLRGTLFYIEEIKALSDSQTLPPTQPIPKLQEDQGLPHGPSQSVNQTCLTSQPSGFSPTRLQGPGPRSVLPLHLCSLLAWRNLVHSRESKLFS